MLQQYSPPQHPHHQHWLQQNSIYKLISEPKESENTLSAQIVNDTTHQCPCIAFDLS